MNSLLKKILFEKRPFAKLALFSFADGFLIILSVFLAFLVRFEGYIPAKYLLNIEGIIILALLITLLIFYFLKLYYFTWSYVSAEELVALIKGVFLSFLILTATFFVLKEQMIF